MPRGRPKKLDNGMSLRRGKASESSIRKRKVRKIYSPRAYDKPRKKANGKKPGRAKKGEKKIADNWSSLKTKFKSYLSKIRFYQALIDTYETELSKSAAQRKLVSTLELANGKKNLLAQKEKLCQLIKSLWSPEDAEKEKAISMDAYDDTGIDAEDIFCATCKKYDSHDNNDILLCDHEGCNKAYHQHCLNPPIETEELDMDPESDWYCHRCSTLLWCLNEFNYEFNSNIDTFSELLDMVKADEKKAKELYNLVETEKIIKASKVSIPKHDPNVRYNTRPRNRILKFVDDGSNILDDNEEHWGSDSDPEDWDLQHASSSEGGDDSDGSDDEQGGDSVDDEASGGLSDDSRKDPESLILHTKRKRKKVDYVALADEMFSGKKDADEDDDDIDFKVNEELTNEETKLKFHL